MRTRTAACILAALTAAPVSAQQAPPDYGHNFITIGDTGNRGWDREDLFGRTTGRGTVNYEYRIAETEVTTAQWVEFMNGVETAGGNAGAFQPFYWGGFRENDQWVVLPGRDLRPLGGINWREAAIYCNWLHNGKRTDSLDAFLSGAYDTSTFTDQPDSNVLVNDQDARSPGAQYFLPTRDEWLKAAHWDPDKNGADQGGWWLYSNSSDVQLVPGLPGEGETTAGIDFPFGQELNLSLKSYPDVQTPWGLLDTSGGGAEWIEDWQTNQYKERRVWMGNSGGIRTFNPDDDLDFSNDLGWVDGSDKPDFGFPNLSFRIASVVPAPGTGVGLVCGFGILIRRRRYPV